MVLGNAKCVTKNILHHTTTSSLNCSYKDVCMLSCRLRPIHDLPCKHYIGDQDTSNQATACANCSSNFLILADSSGKCWSSAAAADLLQGSPCCWVLQTCSSAYLSCNEVFQLFCPSFTSCLVTLLWPLPSEKRWPRQLLLTVWFPPLWCSV